MNGVCVIWKGWIDLHRLDGTAHLEYDEGRAQVRFRKTTLVQHDQREVYQKNLWSSRPNY